MSCGMMSSAVVKYRNAMFIANSVGNLQTCNLGMSIFGGALDSQKPSWFNHAPIKIESFTTLAFRILRRSPSL